MITIRSKILPSFTSTKPPIYNTILRNQKRNSQHSHILTHAFNRSDDDEDEQSLDIDQLAARLAAEAERLRQRQSNENSAAPFGYESKSREAEALAYIGDGGFSASDFELLQELGSISIQQVSTRPDEDLPSSPFPSPSEKTAQLAIIAYIARYYSGMPFQDPVPTFLKEYHPGAKAVAYNELLVLKHLCGIPDIDGKWRTAASPLTISPPIVELLGYFLAGPSERSALADPTLKDSNLDIDTIWVVSKWDNMAPLSMYPSAQQTSGFGLGKLFGGAQQSMKDRYNMLKSIVRGMLSALAFCHEKYVVHGSVGSGSFLLSTFRDEDSQRLVVKLDNFGFARRIVMPSMKNMDAGGGTGKIKHPSSNETSKKQNERPPETLYQNPFFIKNDDTKKKEDGDESSPLADAMSRSNEGAPFVLVCRADQRQLAIVILETILSSLAASGPSTQTTADAVLRVLGDVFGWNIEQYKQYCSDEPEWEQAVSLLSHDGDAGWMLIDDLIQGRHSTNRLLEESLFLVTRY